MGWKGVTGLDPSASGPEVHRPVEVHRPLEVYGPFEEARYLPEHAKESARSDFERDRARILHSAALRRLGTKTQVLGPSFDDFVRTRLTHSLEVAQVGRGIAQELGCDPEIVDAACLAHDLGHPPFGHNGELALDEAAAEIGGFEGNAQTFRLVVRLEAKIYDGAVQGGLNLTRATLDAICKYPWPRGGGPDPGQSSRKFGVYDDDLPTFEWMRQGAPEGARCLESQVMDFSDDVAYSVHDFEDAVVIGSCDLPSLTDPDTVRQIVARTRRWYGDGFSEEELVAAAARLTGQQFWPEDYRDSYRGRAQMKNLTSQLIGRFCAAAVRATREQYGEGPLARYLADLVVPRQVLAEIQFLKGVAVYYVMGPREHEPVYYQQRTLILDLVEALMEAGPTELEEPYAEQWRSATTEAGRLRAVIDQIACLTDFSAEQWHARLRGLLSTLL